MTEYHIVHDHTQMRPDDLLEYRCSKFGIVTQWRVSAVRLASEGYQSMIDVLPVTNLPMDTSPFSVPEQMTRSLTIIRKDEDPHE